MSAIMMLQTLIHVNISLNKPVNVVDILTLLNMEAVIIIWAMLLYNNVDDNCDKRDSV